MIVYTITRSENVHIPKNSISTIENKKPKHLKKSVKRACIKNSKTYSTKIREKLL